MRKPKISILVILTVAFAAFTLGLLVGRTQNHGAIYVNVPQRMLSEPAPSFEPETEPTEQTVGITFPIDINRAGLDEFMALPGIGEVLAKRIVAYRDEHGAFSAAEDLLQVDGIGKKKLEEIWDMITIGG